MTKAIIEGNTITAVRPLMVAREALVNSADDIVIVAGNDGYITHAAPGTGCYWVVSEVTIGFDIQPLAAFDLYMTYDVGAGAVTCFQTHIGAGNPVGGTDVSTMGVFGFYFPVSRRFPNDAEVIVRCDSGDGAVSASMNILSWVEEEV